MAGTRKIAKAQGYDLTAIQMMFVKEYLVDFNASAAARRAGYSEKTCSVRANTLMKTPEVQRAINDLIQARCERVEITADMVVQELAKIAFSNITDVCEWDDNLVRMRNSEDMPSGVTSAVAEVSQVPTSEGMAVKVRMYDKMGALNLLAKHLGMIQSTKHIHTGPEGGPIQYQNVPVEQLKQISHRLIEFQRKAIEAGN